MLILGLLVIEAAFVFYTSRHVYRAIFYTFYKLFRSRVLSEKLVFLFFLPGVIIHELAHILVAEVMFVKTFKIDIAPKMEESGFRMGSVQIEKTDFVRRAIIGVAPFIAGVGVIYAFIFFFRDKFDPERLFSSPSEVLIVAVVAFAVFIISNTMFSSKKDIEGVYGLLALLAFLILVVSVAAVLSGYNLFLAVSSFFNLAIVRDVLWAGVLALFAAAAINCLFVIIAKIILRVK